MRILNLGAGVQSSTLLLMACHGELEVDRAIFADTGHEPEPVYEWMDWLQARSSIPIDVVREPRATLGGAVMEGWAAIPVHTPQGPARARSCTDKFKVRPIERRIRELLELGPRANPQEVLVTQLFGISLDEVQRVKPNPHRWIRNEWPLLDRRMTRDDCLTWLADRGYPEPPKSACYFCPYRSRPGWTWLREAAPRDFQRAVEFEAELQARSEGGAKVNGGLRAQPFLHPSLRPLPMVDLGRPAGTADDECTGVCFT